VIDELLRPLNVPTIYNLPLGHGKHLATLPLGVHARLNADKRPARDIGVRSLLRL